MIDTRHLLALAMTKLDDDLDAAIDRGIAAAIQQGFSETALAKLKLSLYRSAAETRAQARVQIEALIEREIGESVVH